MRILVLGGDGFCGWPTSLRLSSLGHEVLIVDNLVRRNIDTELEVSSLTPIRPLRERLATWKEISGKEIAAENFDIAEDYYHLLNVVRDYAPDTIIHLAEQKSAPYSMKSPSHRRYTVDKNTNATTNLLVAIVESGINAAVVHLGTMGVYGYSTPGIEIPEGYLAVKMENLQGEDIRRDILYPADPGSIYHMTKVLDQYQFAYFNKNDRVRITDLHQGIVWGTDTAETRMDPRLINRFDYDGDYGTVLNRFIVQAAVGHPLTVHGKGGQTRAFINIEDCVSCITLAIENPPQHGERVRIMNQMTEVHRIIDVAEQISRLADVPIKHVDNPRVESEDNELQVKNAQLLGFGLQPILLEEGLIHEIKDIAVRYAENCDQSKIPSLSRWRPE